MAKDSDETDGGKNSAIDPGRDATMAGIVRESEQFLMQARSQRVLAQRGDNRIELKKPFLTVDQSIPDLPPLDITECGKAYMVRAELPGVEEKNIEVAVEDGILFISGEKRSEASTHEQRYHVSERTFGTIRRNLRLPVGIDVTKIDARFENGVLTILLPKFGKH